MQPLNLKLFYVMQLSVQYFRSVSTNIFTRNFHISEPVGHGIIYQPRSWYLNFISEIEKFLVYLFKESGRYFINLDHLGKWH